jgi:hypothetical protein
MMVVIWVKREGKYFFGEGWTAKSQVGPSGKSMIQLAASRPLCPRAMAHPTRGPVRQQKPAY